MATNKSTIVSLERFIQKLKVLGVSTKDKDFKTLIAHVKEQKKQQHEWR